MERDRGYLREVREKKIKQRKETAKNLYPLWSISYEEAMKDIEQHKGYLANGNNGYLSDGTHVKTNTRKGYASYRHKGAYGAANNYKRHDQQQVEAMEQDFSEYMNAPEKIDENIGETDTHICAGCKFWLWYEDERQERCSIKGCWSGSKYVPYRIGCM